MKALIVEDETAAAKNLIAVIKEVKPEIEIVTVLDSVESSVDWLKSNPSPDLIFMDIHLADGQSFLIFKFAKVDAPVIFTTAYDEYAIEAFKVNSIDYLLKPIQAEDVKRAIDKFDNLTSLERNRRTEQIDKMLSEQSYLKTYLVHFKDKMIPIPTSNIACFYSQNNKTGLITIDNKDYTIDKTLETIIEKLDPKCFYRANRQFIIAHNAIAEVVVWFNNRLAVKLGIQLDDEIIISKARVSDFKKWLTKN